MSGIKSEKRSVSVITGIIQLGIVLAVAASFSACGKKDKKEEEESSVPTSVGAAENTSGDSDSGEAMGLQTVHFDYDKYTLTGETKRVLKANAQILKDKSSLRVQIEGHCDSRGGIQYNIALGEKRANSARKYLMDLGISGDRVTTISFGKERPIASGDNEAAWAKNRRGNFAITSR
jgi:peptidoglycan-associated lipoprotein